MRSAFFRSAGTALFLVSLSNTGLHAEDTRHKWQFGGGFSYWSTDDNIRSNATTAFAPPDPTQAGNLASITFSDPRPDANELNEPTIQDSFKFDFNASYGLTRWVALELGMSYFRGDVGNIEFYSEDRAKPIPALVPSFDAQCPPASSGLECKQVAGSISENSVLRNGFLPVGQITQVPVQLSGIVRFRPESPFDPYVGGGVGYIFASLDTGASRLDTPIVISSSTSAGTNRLVAMRGFDDVTDFTNGLEVQSIQSGARGITTWPPLGQEGVPKAIAPLMATVEDGSEYHLMGGVDYYFSNRFSLFIDGRYVWARSKIKIRIDNQTQISSGVKDFGCVNGAPTCRTLNDPEGEDTSNVFILNDSVDDSFDRILIQGGDIRLGGFSLGLGVKFTF